MPEYGGTVCQGTGIYIYTPMPHTCRVCCVIEGQSYATDWSLDESGLGVDFTVDVNGKAHSVHVVFRKTIIPLVWFCDVELDGSKVQMRRMW